MKRGFTQTLMMAAIVVMAAQAMAMAPIISEIPSPIVGDKDVATPANTFVYPDAIDLSQYVSDRETTPTQIKWYYEIMSGSEHIYSINNAPEITSSDNLATPNNIPAAKIIAGPGKTSADPLQGSNPNKITIRNKKLSPISGSGTAFEAGNDYAQDVTLYASDGDTVTVSQPITFFTSQGVNGRLSPGGIKDVEYTFAPGATNGFAFKSGQGHLGQTVTTKGICMSVGLPGEDALGYYESPFSAIKLANNAAYRIRLKINGTQTAENQTPLWDVVIGNLWIDPTFDPTAPDFTKIHGKQAYGADFWMYDGTGGQNGYVQLQSGNDVTYDFWWTPAAVRTTQWNDTSATNPGLYSTAAGADDKDGMVWFRVYDMKGTRGADWDLHASQTVGSLCLKSMTVERYDLDNLTTASLWTASDWTVRATPASSATAVGWHNSFNPADANFHSSLTSEADGIVVKAASGSDATANCYNKVAPGDGYITANAGDAALAADDYPCAMEPATLYKITYKLSAPTAADALHPMDAIWLSADMMTMEEIQESYTTSMAYHHGMPTTAAQEYVSFFYSNYGTNLSKGGLPAYWNSFRTTFAFTNNSSFVYPGAETKTGAIKISGVKIEKVVSGM